MIILKIITAIVYFFNLLETNTFFIHFFEQKASFWALFIINTYTYNQILDKKKHHLYKKKNLTT